MDQPYPLPYVIMDRDAALATLDGDEILLRELIALCLRDSPSLLMLIRDAVNRQDGSSLSHAAHTLKGSAQQLCARESAIAAQQLEDIGRTHRWGDAADALAALERRFADLLGCLASMSARENAAMFDSRPNLPPRGDSTHEARQ